MVYIHNEILLSHRTNETMSFAATWMHLEIIAISEVRLEREGQIAYDITYMWNLKCGTKELTYKTETDSQTWRAGL